MTGVASNLYRESSRSRWAFLAGLTTGSTLSALLLATITYAFGRAIESVASEAWRDAIFVLVIAALGIADLLGRTPHVWRQVPQAIVRILPSGRLGVVWGFDMGLLFTTQKVVSLGWGALLAVLLLAPSYAPILLLVMSLSASLGVIGATVAGGFGVATGRQRDVVLLRGLRLLSGMVLVGAAIISVLA